MSEPKHTATPEPTADPLSPILLRISDVCAVMQLSEREVRHRVSLGMFPTPIRFGRAVRWHRPTLESWLAAGCPAIERR